jgi:hypothetical protein
LPSAGPAAPRHLFGEGSKRLGGRLVFSTEQRRQARGDQRRLVDRRLVMLVQVATKPARRDARMPARVLARDQDRQLESLGEAYPKELPRRRLSDGQVPALDRPSEDR